MSSQDSTDLTYASAATLAQAIRERKFSSLEVIDAHLQRIEDVNPKLNAVVQLAGEARDQARDADAAIARGDALGPLHGVPFTVKDWIETEGLICAAGHKERAEFVPKRDATVVVRMREAGAILLGKTNVLMDNPVYGPTHNPYDVSRSPGYSSSGEAAIIAAGGSPLGLGSDSGGSIRFPAHCCGVAGLKPSSGRVPNTGHFPRISAMNDPRTQIGPIARFVDDLALALPIIAGVDWRDAGVIPMPPGDPGDVVVDGLRVAFYTDDGVASPDARTVEVLKNCVAVMRDAGMKVEEARPPRIEESLDITMKYWSRTESISWTEWMPGGEGKMTGDEVDRSLFEWDRLRRAMLSFMERYSVILCPVAEYPAGRPGAANGRDFIYMLPYSLTGWPCVAVRAGESPEGLPIGVQVIAQPWREDVALAVARRIEQALGGWQAPVL